MIFKIGIPLDTINDLLYWSVNKDANGESGVMQKLILGISLFSGALIAENASDNVESTASSELIESGNGVESSSNSLFKPEEEQEWNLEIAFEDAVPQQERDGAEAESPDALDPVDVQAVAEAFIFENIEKVDVDPESFDVQPLDEISDEEPNKSGIDLLLRDNEGIIYDNDLSIEELALLNALLHEKNQKRQNTGPQLETSESMVYVPESTVQKSLRYQKGRQLTTTLLPINNRPVLLVKNSAFYIDKSPVTHEEYQQFLTATHRAPPLNWVNGQIPQGREKDPVVNISYEDASAYASWLGRRLPTEEEWTRAFHKNAITPHTHLYEWTSTTPRTYTNVIVSPYSNPQVLNAQFVDYDVSFRTVKD